MRELVSDLESRFDLVIIDTPAALAVSDAVPLMQSVSGVILIARMNRSTRDTVRRLQKIIIAAHGSLLGAVATGVSPGPGYEKYSRAYYSTSEQGRTGRRKRGKDAAKIAAVPDPTSSSDDIAALQVLPRDSPQSARANE
jgi:Mrp family chromosome partitioning ATPase